MLLDKNKILNNIFPFVFSNEKRAWITNIFLITTNIIPIIGIIFYNWNPLFLLLIYWAESGIIGILNIFKMILAGSVTKDNNFSVLGLLGSIFLSAFFTIHYGGFMAGHLIFLVLFFFGVINFSNTETAVSMPSDNAFENGTEIISRFFSFGSQSGVPFIFSESFVLICLFASHIVSLFMYFVKDKEYIEKSSIDFMAQPYSRIFVMHITIVLGAFLLAMTGWKNKTLIILWVILKIFIDLRSHSKSHLKKVNKNNEAVSKVTINH